MYGVLNQRKRLKGNMWIHFIVKSRTSTAVWSISAVSVWIELQAPTGHDLTIDTAQVNTYDKVKCVVDAVSIEIILEVLLSLAMCVYGCYNTITTHTSPTLNLPPRAVGFIFNSFDHENKHNWNANKRADGQHMHTGPHTLLHTGTHTQNYSHARKHTY